MMKELKGKIKLAFDAMNIVFLGMMYAFLFYIILSVGKVM